MIDRLNVLIQARARLADGWCQNAEAVTKSGRSVEPFSKDACRFCALGATMVACGHIEDAREKAARILDSMIELLPVWFISGVLPRPGEVVRYNDEPGRTQAEVLALFDDAIQHQLALEVA